MISDLTSIVTAIGGLGTASFAIVDTLKTKGDGGVSKIGFNLIETQIGDLLGTGRANDVSNTLKGSWINGVALVDQKAKAKVLVKATMTKDDVNQLSEATDVSVADINTILAAMTGATATGAAAAAAALVPTPLSESQRNALGKFDLALTSLLDACYQRADQKYRNSAKSLAMLIAVLLALLGGALTGGSFSGDGLTYLVECFFAGLLAAPLAPISKDLAGALAAGKTAAQALRS